jgi:SlyX protein
MSEPTHSDDRVELESKIAFLERTVDDLNDVILEQGKSLEELGRRLAKLEGRIDPGGDSESGDGDLDAQRPPHY